MLIAILFFQPAFTAPVPPDPKHLLDQAIGVLGGADRLAALDRWIVEGHGRENLTAEFQGRSPEAPTWRDHRESVGVVRSLRRIAWERKTPRNDGSLRWRRFISGADSSGMVDWTAGLARMRATPTSEADRQGLMRRIPHLLLSELASAPAALRSLPSSKGRDVIAVTLPDQAAFTIELDHRHRLVAVEYAVAIAGFGSTVVRWSWPDWRPDPALAWIPRGHRIAVGGVTYQEVRYSRYQAGVAAADSLVRVPADPARFAIPLADTAFPSVAPPSGPAPGIHLIGVDGFNSLLVEFADFAMLIEAPASHPGLEAIPASGNPDHARVGRELRRRAEEIAPAKPIRYVVATHHHDDHLGGLGSFAQPGTTVLVAPRHRQTAAKALAGSRGTATIETVASMTSIADSTRRVEVIRVGNSPHTTDGLVVWLPAERILFQGDLFYFEPNGPFPPRGRAIMNGFFARWLEQRRIEPAAIYGVHSLGAAGPSALSSSRNPW